MSFEWSTSDVGTMTLTLYETNLTLNKAACEYFDTVDYVLLGIDTEERKIGIKPISNQDIDNEIYPMSQLHKISIGKSYGRISNKAFVQKVAEDFDLDFSKQQTYKYSLSYDVVHQIMIAEL